MRRPLFLLAVCTLSLGALACEDQTFDSPGNPLAQDGGKDAPSDAPSDATDGSVQDAPTDQGAIVDASALDGTVQDARVQDASTDARGVEDVSQPDVVEVPSDGGVRVYVAGESVEQYNRWLGAPLNSDGTLRSSADSTAEYGWMAPFQQKLAQRDARLRIEWVGSGTWTGDANEYWNDYSGTYPASSPAPRTSALAGTTIDEWQSEKRGELVAKTYCYDVAFASRGGNELARSDDPDRAVADATYKDRLKGLVRDLDRGSSCRTHPIVYVTAHFADVSGWNYGWTTNDVQLWRTRQRHYYVELAQAVVTELRTSDPSIVVRFVDMNTPFLENRATTAFPSPSWIVSSASAAGTAGGEGPTAKLHRDGQHPKRLASIYAGEIVAGAIDPSDWLPFLP